MLIGFVPLTRDDPSRPGVPMPDSHPNIDRWIVEASLGRTRIYVVHRRQPRFVAALSEEDDGSCGAHQVEALDPDGRGEILAILKQEAAMRADHSACIAWVWVPRSSARTRCGGARC
jgi:hypothetical protein